MKGTARGRQHSQRRVRGENCRDPDSDSTDSDARPVGVWTQVWLRVWQVRLHPFSGRIGSFIKRREGLLMGQALGKALQLPWRTRQFHGDLDKEELMTKVSGALGIRATEGEGRVLGKL